MDKISINFLNELFLSCLNKRDVIEIVSSHLKYQYIPTELGSYKKILKSIITIYQNTDKLPSVGVISQQYPKDVKVQEVLTEIKKTTHPDKEILLSTFEGFIKQSMFIALNEKLKSLFNDGKSDDAITLQAKESEAIVNFTIKKIGGYLKPVFAGFNKRNRDRQIKVESGQAKGDKIPFGIEPLDIMTNGGIDTGDTVLWIMRSGIGKSTALKWHGVSAARRNRNVLHLQLEGTEQETMDKYDQVWTACLYNNVRKGNIHGESYQKLQKIISHMQERSSDIYVHAYEEFNTASMVDVRNLISDFEKQVGHVDMVILDYLKYLHPGDGIRYGASTQDVKMKKETTMEKIKNLAVEWGTRAITADQASDVPPEIYNDPSKVLTRHNISGAKGLVDSSSYFFTGNQTNDERKKGLLRINVDKFRNYRLPNKPIKIYTNYDRGRFYSYNKTKDQFYNTVDGRYEF